jgi:phosphoserine aminotransferase
MPPGLGVLIVNNHCIEKSIELKKKGYNIGAHHTFESYQKNYLQFETPSTPNVIAIYLIGKIAEDMNQKGIDNIREEIKLKADMLYNFGNESQLFSPFVDSKIHQSDTVVVLNSSVDSSIIINHLKDKGFHIGSGYGSYKKNHVRIANFPATSVDKMNQLIELMKGFELNL